MIQEYAAVFAKPRFCQAAQLRGINTEQVRQIKQRHQPTIMHFDGCSRRVGGKSVTECCKTTPARAATIMHHPCEPTLPVRIFLAPFGDPPAAHTQSAMLLDPGALVR